MKTKNRDSETALKKCSTKTEYNKKIECRRKKY